VTRKQVPAQLRLRGIPLLSMVTVIRATDHDHAANQSDRANWSPRRQIALMCSISGAFLRNLAGLVAVCAS